MFQKSLKYKFHSVSYRLVILKVRWVSHNQCWITAANDDVIRLWDAQGTLLRAFPYKGGPVQCIFVDDVNKRILLSTLDTTVSVMRVDHPVPITTSVFIASLS